MSDQLSMSGTFQQRSNLTLLEKLAEAKVSLVLVTIVSLLVMSAGLLCNFHCPSMPKLLNERLLYILCCFVGGMLLGLGTVIITASTARFNRRMIVELNAIEECMHNGLSQDIRKDLQSLVDGNLSIKRLDVADFYSRQLMELSLDNNKLLEVMLSTDCWASNPTYNKSLRFWFLSFFETRGRLTLTSNKLQFVSKPISFDLPLSSISNVSIKTQPRWLKPLPLTYIALSLNTSGQLQSIYLTPSLTQFDTVWQVNESVRTWHARITAAIT